MKQSVKLTESKLRDIINEMVCEAINEGEVFSHQNNEWGNDYFTDALTLLSGMYNALKAMEDKGNSNDYRSTIYFYRQFVDRYKELGRIVPLIKNYIKEPSGTPFN